MARISLYMFLADPTLRNEWRITSLRSVRVSNRALT